MARFTGKNLYAEFIYSGGTVVITGDQTQMSINPTVNMIDADAGDDTYKVRIPGLLDFTMSWAARIDQTNYVSVENALQEGNEGTLLVYPMGTVTGQGYRKYTAPVVSAGAVTTWPYNNVCEMTCDFNAAGLLVRGTI